MPELYKNGMFTEQGRMQWLELKKDVMRNNVAYAEFSSRLKRMKLPREKVESLLMDVLIEMRCAENHSEIMVNSYKDSGERIHEELVLEREECAMWRSAAMSAMDVITAKKHILDPQPLGYPRCHPFRAGK